MTAIVFLVLLILGVPIGIILCVSALAFISSSGNEVLLSSYGLQMFDAVGCSGCNEGYKGRVGIYQVMPVSEDIAKIILAGGNAMQIAETARMSGIRDLRASAMLKVKQGVTSLAEINRVTKD